MLWLQLHWLTGIACGVVVGLVGVTGGIGSFEDDLRLALNPDMRTVVVAGAPTLSASQLADIVRAKMPDRVIQTIAVGADPTGPALVTFAPDEADGLLADPTRGEMLALNPSTGAILGVPQGDGFFLMVSQLNRFLLAEEEGKLLVALSTLSLILLSLSGFYFRWPRHLGSHGNCRR